MGQVRNLLFIMADQLRWDHLSCYGHPTLQTPNLDWLALRGVRFERAYAQSPVCGPSRMSFYTGRYMSTHRAFWNFVPLPLTERTLGEYLSPCGIRVAVAGKTHVEPDREGLQRLRIDPGSAIGRVLSEGGFEPFDRDDGVHPEAGGVRVDTRYADYLRSLGYSGDNPWHDYANSAIAADGTIRSGWNLRHARLPARVREEESETAYMTRRAIDFIESQQEAPWCLHLSYIKPHWPYVAPAPYHDLYGREDLLPVCRAPSERDRAHPVYAAYQHRVESIAFSRPEVRAEVAPTYMGLVKQLDDHLGRLFDHLDRSGRFADTLVVFTSDHGDYLGDHWLGEKELFHDASARIPLIVYDPDPAADATRGTVERRLVESIDIVPTFLEATGVARPEHVLEGRSLVPLVRDAEHAGRWREFAVSEVDYSFDTGMREALGRPVRGCRATMVCDGQWKLAKFEGFDLPQLFDLENDPWELADLGRDPARAGVRRRLMDALNDWARSRPTHERAPDDWVNGWRKRNEAAGVHIGRW
jgi:arylsulfatase A-like enzyme